MASASSQVRTIEQFVCGMSLRERQQRAHLLDTSVQSGLWYSRQMVSALSHQDIRILNATTGNTETTRHVDFTDHSVINEEGWICGSEGELLMWIPPPHRAHLHRPSNIWVAGEHETRIDFSTFVHDRSWTTCINT